MTPEVSCEVASRWLSRAIDEEISSHEEALLESHLDSCPHCREDRERLFADVASIESGWAGVSDEIEELLRDRIGDDPIAVAERAARASEPRPTGRPRVWATLAALALLSAAALFVFVGNPPVEAPTVLVEWGPAGLEHTHGGRAALLEGSGSIALGAGTRIRVPSGSEAWLDFSDESYARLGETSRLRFDELESEISIELISGRAAFQVEPRAELPFRVLTPIARLEVVGTRFGVIHEEGRTIITVDEGEIAVTRRYVEMDPFRLGPGARIELTKRGVLYDSAGNYEYSGKREPNLLGAEAPESSGGQDPESLFTDPTGGQPVGSGDGVSGAGGSGAGGSGAAENPSAGQPGPLDLPSGGRQGSDDEEDE